VFPLAQGAQKKKNTTNIYIVTSTGDKKHHPKNKQLPKNTHAKQLVFPPI